MALTRLLDATCLQVVQIVGNNRTKAAYIGLRAVVKRAQGLGGWHYILLPTGEEIKLQRNALLVLELPTGNEQVGGLPASWAAVVLNSEAGTPLQCSAGPGQVGGLACFLGCNGFKFNSWHSTAWQSWAGLGRTPEPLVALCQFLIADSKAARETPGRQQGS